jgi:hypothetical protein
MGQHHPWAALVAGRAPGMDPLLVRTCLGVRLAVIGRCSATQALVGTVAARNGSSWRAKAGAGAMTRRAVHRQLVRSWPSVEPVLSYPAYVFCYWNPESCRFASQGSRRRPLNASGE